MLKHCKSIGYSLNLQFHNQCLLTINNLNRQTWIQTNQFSDWKYNKDEEYFPSLKKSKSGPQIILNPDETFESPYTKIKKQKNPSFSNQNEDILSSLQPLLSDNKEEEIESDYDSIIKQQNEQYEITKYKQWKSKQIKTKEYIPRSDYSKPRTLEDFKNWNIKQDEILKAKQKQYENIKNEEELRSYDLQRSGHIIQALRPPPNITKSDDINSDLLPQKQGDNDELALIGQHKFDFHSDSTYIIEGEKYFEYYMHKYGYYFSTGFIKISILSSITLYLLLYQNYITQNEIIDWLQIIEPYKQSTISIAKSINVYDIWYNTLFGSCILPIIITSSIYAKYKGELWEYKQLKKNGKENINLKTDILTLQNKGNISKNKIIYEIALIKERRKERMNTLTPLHDVVDIAETFSPHRKSSLSYSNNNNIFKPKQLLVKSMKINKMIKKYGISKGLHVWMGTSFSAMDPRRVGSTQTFGLLKLQTRLDEFGRVIPGWQRQSTKLWIVPTVTIFLFFPMFGDWLFGWTV